MSDVDGNERTAPGFSSARRLQGSSDVSGLLVVGLGDHARVLREVATSAGMAILGFVDPQGSKHLKEYGGVPVMGSLDEPDGWLDESRPPFFVAAVGDNNVRRELFERCLMLGMRPQSLVHSSATILGGAVIEPGAHILAGAVVGVDAIIGANVIVNTAASVDHDCRIGKHSTIGPGAHLAGRVSVGVGCHVGLGALVREGTHVGDGAYVAAGAVVIRDVSPGVTVLGVPAKPR